MANNRFLRGLVGVIAGSAAGLVLVLCLEWEVWWQVIAAIAIGGLVGLLVADPKWVVGRVKKGLIAANAINFNTSIANLLKQIFTSKDFFAGCCLLIELVVKWIVLGLFGLAVLSCCCLHWLISEVFVKGHPAWGVIGIVVLGLIVVMAFVLLWVYPIEYILGNSKERISRRAFSTLYNEGNDGGDAPESFKEVWQMELIFLKAGFFEAIKIPILFGKLLVFLLLNAILLPVSLVYLYREVWKSNWHLSVVLSVALSIIIGRVSGSWLSVAAGVGYFTLSGILARIELKSFSEIYQKCRIVWRFKFADAM